MVETSIKLYQTEIYYRHLIDNAWASIDVLFAEHLFNVVSKLCQSSVRCHFIAHCNRKKTEAHSNVNECNNYFSRSFYFCSRHIFFSYDGQCWLLYTEYFVTNLIYLIMDMYSEFFSKASA